MTTANKTIQLDTRGEICPYPMMKAVDQMKKTRAGR